MFRTLVGHFARRLAQSGSEESGDVDMGLGAMLALLAAPGAFIAIGLMDHYSSLLRYFRGQVILMDQYPRAVADGYSLLAYSMAVTGLVTLWKWDRILPDATDRLNLGPLPIPARRMFLASLSAIGMVVAVFILDVNAGSMVLFPLVVTAEEQSAAGFLRLALAHFTVLAVGSLFAFCCCFSLMGILIAAAPGAWFAGLSMLVRAGAGFALLMMLMTAGRGGGWLRMVRMGTATWQAWTPPVWFAALYGPLLGRSDLGADGAWQRGLLALFVTALVALAGYGLGYRRGMEGRLVRSAKRRRWPEWLLRQGLTPLERAAFRFSLLTLWRSERHSLMIISMFGAGLVIGGLHGGSAELPFFGAYSLTLAIRAAFQVPALAQANWPFRLLAVATGDEPRRVARRILWLHVALLVMIPTLFLAPIPVTFMLAVMEATLIEALLLDFRQIPFTVPTEGFRNTSLVYGLGAILGLAMIPWAGGRLAVSVSEQPWRALVLLGVLGAARHYRAEAVAWFADGRGELEFETKSEDVIRLRL